jgi:Integrase zinc binding domain
MKHHFAVNDKGLLVRLSPIDEAEEVVVPRCLANRVICLAHIPRLAAHPRGTRMYATLRKSFCWLTMAKDIYQSVANCLSCANNRLKRNRQTTYLKLFPPSQPLEFESLDVLGTLPVTKSGIKYLVVFGDRYSKAMRVVAVPNICSAARTNVVLQIVMSTIRVVWLVSSLPLLFLHDDFASRHLHIQLLRNDYTVPTWCRHRGGIVDPPRLQGL